MSNHSGSYMLNETLTILDSFEIFKLMGKEKTAQFFEEMKKVIDDWDCNSYEVLEGIGSKLSICYGCFQYQNDLDEQGLCKRCEEEC